MELTTSLDAQQASLTTGIPAVRGIGNPALCALHYKALRLLPTRWSCFMYTYNVHATHACGELRRFRIK